MSELPPQPPGSEPRLPLWAFLLSGGLGLAVGLGVTWMVFSGDSPIAGATRYGRSPERAGMAAPGEGSPAEVPPDSPAAGLPEGTSLLEEMRRRTAKLSFKERHDELHRMIAEDNSHRDQHRARSPERMLYYLVLIQPEDIPALREEMLAKTHDENDDSWGQSWIEDAVFEAWAHYDLPGLEQWLQAGNIPKRSVHSAAFMNYVVRRGHENPMEAWDRGRAMFDAIPEKQRFYDWTHLLLPTLGAQDGPGIIHRIMAMGELEGTRGHLLWRATWGYANQDFAGALSLSENPNLSTVERTRMESGAVNGALSGAAPPYAEVMDYVLERGTDRARARLSAHLQDWLKKDPKAAEAWLAAHGDELTDQERDLLEKPKDAYDDSLPPKEKFQQVLTWKESSMKRDMISQGASEWAVNDPQAALAYLPELEEGAVRSNAASGMIAALADYDPQLALGALEHVTEERARGLAFSNIMSRWADYAPEEASQWLNEQPASSAKDRGISALILNMDKTDFEGAAQWVLQISGDHRESQLAYTLRSWREVDADAARAWLAAQKLTPETRAKFEIIIQGGEAPTP